MGAAWGGFAIRGNPSSQWHPFTGTAGNPLTFQFNTPNSVSVNYNKANCQFWDDLVPGGLSYDVTTYSQGKMSNLFNADPKTWKLEDEVKREEAQEL